MESGCPNGISSGRDWKDLLHFAMQIIPFLYRKRRSSESHRSRITLERVNLLVKPRRPFNDVNERIIEDPSSVWARDRPASRHPLQAKTKLSSSG
jgi:hypothetical protein